MVSGWTLIQPILTADISLSSGGLRILVSAIPKPHVYRVLLSPKEPQATISVQ
jgi:hypothetical protein